MARKRNPTLHLTSSLNVAETLCGQNALSAGVKIVGLEVFRNALDPAVVGGPLPLRAPKRCAHCQKKHRAACSHKFVDSKHCLKCGWLPPPRS